LIFVNVHIEDFICVAPLKMNYSKCVTKVIN